MMENALFAGIELGGTKAMAVLARGATIIASHRVPTGTPETTLSALETWLDSEFQQQGKPLAFGIASFGPLGLQPGSPDHGRITTTPKPGWSGTEPLKRFRDRFHLPTGFDTDVNAAALAEGRWGAAIGFGTHVYITIGTGVGAGIVVNGRPTHGLTHPEFGHVRLRRVPGDHFTGTCKFHGDCLEGLVSGPALAARAGMDPASLPADHPLWGNVVADLAEAIAILCLTVSPERILIGGGVGLGQSRLLARVAAEAELRLAAYLPDAAAALRSGLLAAPALGDNAGPLGAIALAIDAFAAAPTP